MKRQVAASPAERVRRLSGALLDLYLCHHVHTVWSVLRSHNVYAAYMRIAKDALVHGDTATVRGAIALAVSYREASPRLLH